VSYVARTFTGAAPELSEAKLNEKPTMTKNSNVIVKDFKLVIGLPDSEPLLSYFPARILHDDVFVKEGMIYLTPHYLCYYGNVDAKEYLSVR